MLRGNIPRLSDEPISQGSRAAACRADLSEMAGPMLAVDAQVADAVSRGRDADAAPASSTSARLHERLNQPLRGLGLELPPYRGPLGQNFREGSAERAQPIPPSPRLTELSSSLYALPQFVYHVAQAPSPRASLHASSNRVPPAPAPLP